MLAEQLADAKAKRQRQLINLICILSAICLLAIMIIVGFSYYQTWQHNRTPLSTTMSSKNSPVPSLATNLEHPIGNDEALRLRYFEILNEYEGRLEPKLKQINLAHWDKTRYEHLSTLKDKSIVAFGNSDYANALVYIGSLKQLAQESIDVSVAQFEIALSDARRAYLADDYDRAKQQIDHALLLDSSSVSAKELALQIDKMPEILRLNKEIDITKTANNHERELSLIDQLIAFDHPKRDVAVQRKQQLLGHIKQAKFNAYIKQFDNAIRQDDEAIARHKWQQAKAVLPAHQDLPRLAEVLQALVQKHQLQRYQQAIKTAIATDDWSTAKQQLVLLLSQLPTDQWAQDMLHKSNNIIALQQQMDGYIAHPYRLSNAQISAPVKATLQQADALLDASQRLKEQTQILSELLEKVNQNIAVDIVSDNKTHIIVRGIGVVGTVKNKTIQLIPGQYQFEGKRTGFKSKLIDVLLSYDKTNYRLEVICDEPI